MTVDGERALRCAACGAEYPMTHDVPSLIGKQALSEDQQRVSAWWDDLCRQWYVDLDQQLTPERLYGLFDEMEKMYRGMDHLVLDMDLPSLAGLDVLDIGCGGGAQDALYRRYGANVSSVDISRERALSAAHKLGMIREGSGFAAQADGERLPFKDGVFDVVYSNGVMHHSESTEAMIAEAYRVLKPGGRVVMMLYAKGSLHYAALLLYWGLARGYRLRYGSKYWLGACTEGAPKFGDTRNPFTRAYTQAEIRQMLGAFTDVRLRKTECHMNHIPILGRRVRRLVCRTTGQKMYRDPFVLIEGRRDYAAFLPIERWLSPSLGWFVNITARKPLRG